MRVSSAVVLAVVVALASSTSAKPAAAPDTASADICPNFCVSDEECSGCIFHSCAVSPSVAF
ncbi:hypothetical protein CY34DRAFT_803922 [Suillus luteus UH-Slu-Lm8-n1]|uniref:Unplaced genomic scaffold CY34scaffold_84, whole genome shotgun sequence n=1 Tax=Suillus luteus UH-Slu-Lm8-n1 TaxID=930992 RepID=A0A0D0BAL7_9AGAM|nr:hypothetical protein CY34DRAFT_803922 [Suillus luteus UH-Slu-Lm8-n1]